MDQEGRIQQTGKDERSGAHPQNQDEGLKAALLPVRNGCRCKGCERGEEGGVSANVNLPTASGIDPNDVGSRAKQSA